MLLEDVQSLLQLGSTHFTLALGTIHFQGGLTVPKGDRDYVFLAVAHFDFHQCQGNILDGQDHQLQGTPAQCSGDTEAQGSSQAGHLNTTPFL